VVEKLNDALGSKSTEAWTKFFDAATGGHGKSPIGSWADQTPAEAYTGAQSWYGNTINSLRDKLGMPKKKFAAGGVVDKPTNALIGEAGPEIVLPLNVLKGQQGGSADDRALSEDQNMWQRFNALAMAAKQHPGVDIKQLSDDDINQLHNPWGGGGGGPGGSGFPSGGSGGYGAGRGPMFRPGVGPASQYADAASGRGLMPWPGDSGPPASAAPDKSGPYSGWPTTDSSGNVISGGSGAVDRSKFRDMLSNNPQMRERIMQIMWNEQGGNDLGMRGVGESLFNRADMEHLPLTSKRITGWHNDGGYYANGNMGRGMNRAQAEAALNDVLGGSNVSEYATENSSGNFARSQLAQGMFTAGTGGPDHSGIINGEYLQTPGNAGGARSTPAIWQAWVEKQKAQAAGGGKPVGPRDANGYGPTGAYASANSFKGTPLPTTPMGSIRPDVLARAAQIAQSGNQGAVTQFLHEQGIQVDDRDCGDFVAGIVKASGGTPVGSYPTGSAWRGYGAGVPDAAHAQPGDVLSSNRYTYGPNTGQPLPPGAVQGGHAAMVGPRGYNPKTGTLDVIQADPLREYDSPMTGYAIRRGLGGDPAPPSGVANTPSGLDAMPTPGPQSSLAGLTHLASAGESDVPLGTFNGVTEGKRPWWMEQPSPDSRGVSGGIRGDIKGATQTASLDPRSGLGGDLR
jgi:hypothetical protein